MSKWLWNDFALLIGRVSYFALAFRLLLDATGFDIDAWLKSIGA